MVDMGKKPIQLPGFMSARPVAFEPQPQIEATPPPAVEMIETQEEYFEALRQIDALEVKLEEARCTNKHLTQQLAEARQKIDYQVGFLKTAYPASNW